MALWGSNDFLHLVVLVLAEVDALSHLDVDIEHTPKKHVKNDTQLRKKWYRF